MSSRNKGHNAERHYAKEFRQMGWSHCQTSRYGSKLLDDCKVDLMNIPFNVQVKAGYSKRGINHSKILREMTHMLMDNFGEVEDPRIVIHKKDVGSGHKRDEFDELVTMSFEDFKRLVNKT